MLTQCQQCKKTYTLSIEELSQQNSSELLCPHCDEMLGRLKRLGSDFFHLHEPQITQPVSHNLFWGLGLFCGVGLLFTQVVIFKWDNLSQKKMLRPHLVNLCLSLNCQLPTYKNINDFEVMYGAFELIENQYYNFQTVISNQGQFPQTYPAIKLSLLGFNGQAFTQRIFYASDYKSQKKLIQKAETVEISMKIAMPEQKLGGYTFELM